MDETEQQLRTSSAEGHAAKTASPEPDGGGLQRHFLRLMLGMGIPIMLLVIALGWRDYMHAGQQVIDEHVRAQMVRRAGLEQIAGTVRTHIAVLRGFAESRLKIMSAFTPYDGATDWLPSEQSPGPTRGLLLSPPESLVTQPATIDVKREMAAITPLYAVARATQSEHPFLRWSYFFAADRSQIVIYPWANPRQMIGVTDQLAAFNGYFGYAVFKLGEPGQNVTKASYWTPVYPDAGGAGLMVSHAAPVWNSDQFAGIVGTDVLLSYLSDYLADFPPVAGKSVVVDQDGNVVAAAGGVPVTGNVATKAVDVLGGISTALTDGAFLRQGADLVSVVPIAGTPWHLVMTIPGISLTNAIWGRIWPHAVMLSGILLTFLLFGYFFRGQFVRPAVKLAAYGGLSVAEAEIVGSPDVPAAWTPLRDRIDIAFREQIALVHQLRAMIDGIPLRAVYVDHRYRYRDANREFLEFVGHSGEQLAGKRVGEVLGENVEAEYVALTPQIRRGEVARFEGWINYFQNGRRYLQVSVLPFTGLGENEPGFLTFTRDLTELKEAEQEAAQSLEALAKSEALHRSIITSSLDAIIVIDEDGITREFNPSAEAIFGYTPAEAIGRSIGDIIVPAATRAAHHSGLANYLKGGPARVLGKRIEVEALHKNGTHLPVELTITEVHMAGQRLFTSHIRDLTEQKRLARELDHGRNRLHQVEKLSAMGSLLAGVAHELNNPLAIVIAQSALLVEKAENEDVKRRGERIRAAADRCGRIVKSFLAMARQKPPQREPTDLNEIIRSSLEMVGYGLRSAGIEQVLGLDDKLPLVAVDRDLISQVISNLLINAQHALLEKPLPRYITVGTRHEPARGALGAVVISIADNGPGVAPEIAQRIFDPYFTTKAAGVGTGIGLSISRNIIDGHGGEISLLERPHGGALFEIRLPVTAMTGLADATGSGADADGVLDILIVDDEPDVAQGLAEMLEMTGHRVTVLNSSAAALEHVAHRKTDVLFTDLRMPGMDGVALIDRLGSTHPALAKRSIIVTGDSFAGPEHVARLQRPDLVMIEKPFGLDDVRQALFKVMQDDTDHVIGVA